MDARDLRGAIDQAIPDMWEQIALLLQRLLPFRLAG